MANALDALIDHIPDEALRGQIREALKKQNQQKKFGLVFEDHIPESTVLYDVPVKAGSTVALRGGDVSKQMKVLAIDGEVAHCISLPEKEPVDQPLESLVSVAKFGEPIYPLSQTAGYRVQRAGQRSVAYADRGGQLSCLAIVGIFVCRKDRLYLHRPTL